jgi:hypothetical protein
VIVVKEEAMTSDAVKTLREFTESDDGGWVAERSQDPDLHDAIREVLAELEDCERDHPPEPWASELKAENGRLRAKIIHLKAVILDAKAALRGGDDAE